MEEAPASCMEMTQPPAKKAKISRVRYPNWEKRETLALVKAYKRQSDEYNIATSKGRVGTNEQKWERISSVCAKDGATRDAEQCRKRWQDLLKNYKKIKNWEANDGKDSYWHMSSSIRKDNNLPGSFEREVYDSMDLFMGSKALMLYQGNFDLKGGGISLHGDNDLPSSSFDGLPSRAAHASVKHEPHRGPSLQQDSWALPKDHDVPSAEGRRHSQSSQADSGNDHLVEALERVTRLAQERCNAQLTEVLADALAKIADAMKKVAENLRKGSR